MQIPPRRPSVSLRPTTLLATLALTLVGAATLPAAEDHSPLLAGVARVDITDYDAGPVAGPAHARALVLRQGDTTAVLISIDAVAIGEIGRITSDFLPTLRQHLQEKLHIPPPHVLVNASHCHAVVRSDVGDLTLQAVQTAAENLVPVRAGAGVGHEDRIMENRRLQLKSGKTVDVRHAYSLPADDAVVAVGPVDPEIGILRLDREDGRPLAILFQFACHPIQGVPGGENTADMTGFAAQAIEETLGEGAVALFLQGCGGDINPTGYKDVNHPRDAQPLGNQLALSTLHAARQIECKDSGPLRLVTRTLALPRGDRTDRIAELEAEQRRLLGSLRGTTLNFDQFLPLIVRHRLGGDFPSAPSYRYLQEEALGRTDLKDLDAANQKNLEAYLQNIATMEELTRVQTNLALLKKHQAHLVAAGSRTLDVEINAFRLGDFRLVTFPGELTVQIGLNLKQQARQPNTFISGYTNGYIYYAPTAEQLLNVGGAQEDSDCLLAPEWQELFETAALELLQQLEQP